MPSQRTLKVGDIITIKGSPKHLLVTRSEHKVDIDSLRGDSYSVDEIDCVEIAPDQWGRPLQNMEYTVQKLKHFYFEGGSMHGKGKQIKDTDVKVVGTSKLSVRVETTFVVKNVKYYGNK